MIVPYHLCLKSVSGRKQIPCVFLVQTRKLLFRRTFTKRYWTTETKCFYDIEVLHFETT